MWARRQIQHVDDLSDPIVAAVIVCASLVAIIALSFALLT